MSSGDRKPSLIKNTAVLYLRMGLVMLAGLYISRVVLDALGEDDFGLYHALAGFVLILGFMQGAMATATQRYFSYDMGKESGGNIEKLFSASLKLQVIFALIIVLAAKMVGLYLINDVINLGGKRAQDAMLVYNASLLGFCFSLMAVPYIALLMASEKMQVYSVIGMIEVGLKLAAAASIKLFNYNGMQTYAMLMAIVSMSTFVLYMVVGKKIQPNARVCLKGDWAKMKEMMGFAGWNIWGNLAASLSMHGNNLLLNIFFGSSVNAARTVASQVGGAVNSFVTNAQAAINPRLVKLYAGGKLVEMHDLLLQASRLNFFIIMLLVAAIFPSVDALLNWWLISVPKYAGIFLKLTLITFLIDSMSGLLMTAAQATGKIRRYHGMVGGLLLVNVPVNYMALTFGANPETVLLTGLALSVLALLLRLQIISPLIHIKKRRFYREVVLVSFGVAAATVLSYGAIKLMLIEYSHSSVVNSLALSFSCGAIIWFFGLKMSEKNVIWSHIKKLNARRISE